MLGLIQPDDGSVQVLGQDARTAVRGGRVGAMLQESGLPILTRVGELVELIRRLSPRPMPADEIVRRAGLAGLVERRTESLSGGEAQRVRFAMAIAGDPDLLFLDEPTVAMDVETRRAFWADMRAFAAEGRTILFATHYLEEADQVADRIVVLDRGRIVADGTAASIKNASSSRHVRFRSAAPDQAFLAALPGAAAVDIAGSRVDIATADSDATARALLRSDLDVRDLEISGPDLEAAFLALTGGDRTAATTLEIHR
jgi:ABC-2 type transport system ATP-binding protein